MYRIPFFIVAILVFCLVLFVVGYLLRLLKKEFDVYRFFSKTDWGRQQMARDPRRFHISIVYLMAVMLRSSYFVELEKLTLIVRYILDVCPEPYREEAFTALDYMTKKLDDNAEAYSLIDKKALLNGKFDSCFFADKGGRNYSNDLHGTQLAEELARYIDEVDRRYLMFLLFRLAIADGMVTDDWKLSELSLLKKLCLDGLHIPKKVFSAMYTAWQKDNLDGWYDDNIALHNKGLYADRERLANIFHSTYSFSQPDAYAELPSSSFFSTIKERLIGLSVVALILLLIVPFYECELMVKHYPFWLGLVFGVFSIATILWNMKYEAIDSSVVSILRSKCENVLQRNRLIVSFVLFVGTASSLYFNAMNILYYFANKRFHCGTIYRKKLVTSTSSLGRNATYCLYFDSFSVSNEDARNFEKPVLPWYNRICVDALPCLSAAWLFRDEGCTMDVTSCSLSDYAAARSATGDVYVNLQFKVGYYGMIVKDGYNLIMEDRTPLEY